MPQAAIYTGGIAHPFAQSAPALANILENAGFTARISFELDEVLGWLKADPHALFVVYALRFSMTQHEKYQPDRARWSLAMPESARNAITRHVSDGAGLLGVHTASICFDDWQEWQDVLGGAWRWGKSWHPAVGPVNVKLSPYHFLTRGLSDFSLTDEVYSDLDLAPGIDIAGHSEAQQEDSSARPTGSQPALWTQQYGGGRVVCDLLGHDSTALRHPVHRRILQRSALWASGRPQHIVEAV